MNSDTFNAIRASIEKAFNFAQESAYNNRQKLGTNPSPEKFDNQDSVKFVNSLRAATDSDIDALNSRYRGEQSTTRYTEGVPFAYSGKDGDIHRGIYYTPTYDKNVVLGFDFDNISMTPDAGLKRLKQIIGYGGTISSTNTKSGKRPGNMQRFGQEYFTDIIELLKPKGL